MKSLLFLSAAMTFIVYILHIVLSKCSTRTSMFISFVTYLAIDSGGLCTNGLGAFVMIIHHNIKSVVKFNDFCLSICK